MISNNQAYYAVVKPKVNLSRELAVASRTERPMAQQIQKITELRGIY